MEYRHKIFKAFSYSKFEALSKLADCTFEELDELKKRYKSYHGVSSTYLKDPAYLMYLESRIEMLEEATTIKIGNEEQAWDYLT